MEKYTNQMLTNLDKMKGSIKDKMSKFHNEIKQFINKIDEDQIKTNKGKQKFKVTHQKLEKLCVE